MEPLYNYVVHLLSGLWIIRRQFGRLSPAQRQTLVRQFGVVNIAGGKPVSSPMLK